MPDASGPEPFIAPDGVPGHLLRTLVAVDRRLLTCGPASQRLIIGLVAAGLTLMCLAYVPRAYVEYARLPLLHHVQQPETYGTDTIADMYEARVVLHDWRDMYT
jgi:hypothetical protein